MNSIKNLFLFVFIFVAMGIAAKSSAQSFSYVYIQGDKKTPIYTKVEGVMMPRYGKNYALLARLAPGPLNVEILFQQNEFPAVQFNIMVPESGKRAFVLQKKDDGFQLYDIEQNFYLKPNNDISEDHLPTVLNNEQLNQEKKSENNIEPIVSESVKDTTRETEKTETQIKNIPEKTETVLESNSTITTTQTALKDSSKPTFIENIIFDNDSLKNDEVNISPSTPKDQLTSDNSPSGIINSDCKGQISALNFLKLNNNIVAKKTENEKLGLILEASKQNCFSTEQNQKMLEKLDSDIAKFTAIKSLYPKTTDQSNFNTLSALLMEEEWKNYFAELIQAP